MAEQALFQPFNRNQQRENLENTKETGLLISLIPSLQEDFYVDSLTTGASKETLSKLLLRNPGIKNETAVIEMIHFLHDEGDRISFSILLPFLVAEYDPKETLSKLLLRNPGIKNETAVIEMIHFLHDEGDRISFSILLPFLVAEYDPKELEEKIRERFFGIELFIRKCNNLHHFITCIKADQTFKIGEEELKRGVLAWDMGRMVCLTRIAYDAGFIDESLAWNYICSAGQQCIQAFNDWTEVGKSFLLGQAMEATEKRKQELYIRLYRQATENPNSPWKKRTLK